MKLADLAAHTRFDADPATGQAMSFENADKEMARKRAIIEAALAKAKALALALCSPWLSRSTD